MEHWAKRVTVLYFAIFTLFCFTLKVNPMTPSVHKMVKHILKISQNLLQHFLLAFDHLIEIRPYRMKHQVHKK